MKRGKKESFLVLEVSRNDAHYGEVVDELDCAVPNRNPDGELGCPKKSFKKMFPEFFLLFFQADTLRKTSLQLPVHLTTESATVVYANHTIFVNKL